ncbi:hypothetical protein GF377_05555, partial [candidate division GN15 bacterium]|nr:hypothetical protein [candidate division GN15 bacterium]
FEVNLGNQRVFGSVGWHNVGRSWEGLNAWLDRLDYRLDAFWLKRRELLFSNSEGDFDILVGNVTLTNPAIQILIVFERDSNQGALEDDFEGTKRFSVGAYGTHKANQLDIEYNGVYQFGSRTVIIGENEEEYDIAAFLITAEVGITLDPEKKARVAAGIDYASGDDDDSDDKVESYNNLYYTGHKFRGYMDYFLSSTEYGLIDLMLRGQVAPTDGWLLKADIHFFSAAADRQIGPNQTSKSIGSEIDLTVSTTRVRGVTIVGGASVFLPSDDFAGEDADPGLWTYGMLIADF